MTDVKASLMVYKEIVSGDLRKLRGQSNDTKSGGGARDLRLPSKTFRPIMERIFTRESTGRGGKPIRVADVQYRDANGQMQTTELSYWPPTSSRPGEDRISQIHSSPALGGQPPETGKGRVFLLLIQLDDGTVRSVYAYEEDLRQGRWSNEVANQILGCVNASDKRGGTRTVMGYYDFENGRGYCHAD